MIGGCLDEEFSDPSRRLIGRCARGDATLVVSDLTLDELENAPRAVQDVLGNLGLGTDAYEVIPVNQEIRALAEGYIESGALGAKMRSDARHIAAATVARVDVLASWNLRHIVNSRRIRLYNEVNRRMRYPETDVLGPKQLEEEPER